MGFLATIALINQIVNQGGPLVVLAIKAFKEIQGASGLTTAQLLDAAQAKHDLDTAKIAALLAETS